MAGTTQTQTPHQAYVDDFQSGGWARRGPGFEREAREEAMRAFAAKGFPTTREEAWRQTSLRELSRTHFAPSTEPHRIPTEEEVAPYRIAEATELVFVDGHHVPALSRLHPLAGIHIEPLAKAIARSAEGVEVHLARHAGDEPMVALNTAYFLDGGYVTIEEDAQPGIVHLLNLATESKEPKASHVRHLIVADPSSEATVVESYVGLPTGGAGLTTAVTELVAGEGAQLRHLRLQRENLHSLHIGRVAIRQDRNANVQHLLFSVGAALARNELDAVLGGEGSELRLGGLFLGTGRQHVDCPTRVEHAVPHTTSRQVYKGILDGTARGVFLGNVKVQAGAAKTLAEQTNRNLLLSTHAAVDTTPQLEILNDDVKCSHGSTIGQLSSDALFFLRSRGIDAEQARLLLTRAFAHEVLHEAPEPLQGLLDDLLAQWFACRLVQGAMQ